MPYHHEKGHFFSNLYINIFLKILIKFLRELVVDNGFTLISHDNKKYKISEVTEKSLNIKILDKSLYGKIVLFPGLYFGEAYMKNKIKIHNFTYLIQLCSKKPIKTLFLKRKLHNHKYFVIFVSKNGIFFFY